MTVSSDAVFVVSGGARGVTARCVVALAARFRCAFVLLGRTPVDQPEPAWAAGASDRGALRQQFLRQLPAGSGRPTPAQVERQLDALLAHREVDATLRAIAEAGGRAEYLAVDIADLPALQAGLQAAAARLGAVTGLIHGAGVLRDRLIEQKSAADLAAVYDVKVRGLENLLRCLPAASLRHLVLFSSVAGFYGNVGQTDYALANEILNKTAHLLARQHPNCRVLSVDWGPWDGGMVGPELKRMFEARGIPLIAPAAGAQVLADALAASDEHRAQLLVGAPLAPPPFELPTEPLHTRLLRRLTLAGNPFLLDHVVGGHAVLPFADALNWIANSCEHLLPGYRFCVAEDVRLLKGIVFDEQLPPEFVLDLAEQSREPGMIRIEARLWSQTPTGLPRYHYQATVELRVERPLETVVSLPLPSGDDGVPGAPLYLDGTLFHGPAFRGVERVYQHGPLSMTLACRLSPISSAEQGQFPVRALNAFALDQQLQGVVIWARQALRAASLPAAIERYEHVASPAFGVRFFVAVEITSSSDSSAVANLTAYDAEGRLLSRLTGAAMTVSPSLNGLFAPHAAGPVA